MLNLPEQLGDEVVYNKALYMYKSAFHLGLELAYSQRAVMLCGWGVKAGMVREWVAGKTV